MEPSLASRWAEPSLPGHCCGRDCVAGTCLVCHGMILKLALCLQSLLVLSSKDFFNFPGSLPAVIESRAPAVLSLSGALTMHFPVQGDNRIGQTHGNFLQKFCSLLEELCYSLAFCWISRYSLCLLACKAVKWSQLKECLPCLSVAPHNGLGMPEIVSFPAFHIAELKPSLVSKARTADERPVH